MAYGFRVYTAGEKFFQVEATTGFYIPARVKKIGFIPYGNLGVGFAVQESAHQSSLYSDAIDKDMGFELSLEGGLLFTATLVPGLFLQTAYQHNFYAGELQDIKPGILFFGIGYGF
jgi:hypothetical protein